MYTCMHAYKSPDISTYISMRMPYNYIYKTYIYIFNIYLNICTCKIH